MHTLPLPAELTIYTVCELRTHWLAWLAGVVADAGDDASIDASAVDQIDAAGVQLLAALFRSFDAKHLALRVSAASETLRSACATLGMNELLNIGPAPTPSGASA